MKKGTKNALIVAAILLVVGLMICSAILVSVDHSAFQLNPEDFEVKSQTITDSVSSIRIHTADANIRLMPAENGEFRVEYPEGKYSHYEISSDNGLLAIQYHNTRKWYQFAIFDFSSWNSEVRVYLPQSQYDALMLHTASGDIAVDLGPKYRSAKLSTASGDIAFHAAITESCDIQTASGTILLHDTGSVGSVHIGTTSGDCTVTNLESDSFYLKSTSGDTVLANITAGNFTATTVSGEMRLSACQGQKLILECTSGDISFTDCDGEEITMSTVSGDIEGSLRSGKIFEGHTTSGDISLPRSEAVSSRCSVKTVSGDIEITVK